MRPGLWQCTACYKQYTVMVGTAFERSHLPLHKWLLAIHLVCASDRAVTSKEIQRRLGVTYVTACFTKNRVREAMPKGGGFEETLRRMLAKRPASR